MGWANGKSGQYDQRDGVLPHATTNPLRRFPCVDLPLGQTVVAGNPILVTGYKGSRRTAALRLACLVQQPVR